MRLTFAGKFWVAYGALIVAALLALLWIA